MGTATRPGPRPSLAGVGSGRLKLGAGLAGAALAVVVVAAVSAALASAGSGVLAENRLMKVAPSPSPTLASAPSASVRVSSRPPFACAASAVFSQCGGSTRKRLMSGLANRLKCRISFWPSRRLVILAPGKRNSTREKSADSATRTLSGPPPAIGASATVSAKPAGAATLAMQIAATPDFRFRFKFTAYQPDLADGFGVVSPEAAVSAEAKSAGFLACGRCLPFAGGAPESGGDAVF